MRTVEPGMPTADAGYTMLVVDDEPFNIDVLTQELEDIGHRAVPAANGREALETIENQRYDLILSDIYLPDMDGMTIAETVRYRQSECATALPIIALTANKEDAFKEQLLASGMNDVIQKPLTFSLAQTLLEKWLGTVPK